MNDITQTANAGVDAQIAPRKAFTSTFGADRPDRPAHGRARVARCPARPTPRASSSRPARSSSSGKTVEPKFAPAIVVSAMRRALRSAAARLRAAAAAARRGLVNRKLAEDEHLRDRPARRRDDPHRHPARAAGRHRRLRQRRLDRRRDADRRADGRRAVLVRPRGQGLARRGLGGARRHARASSWRACARRCRAASRSRPASRPPPTTPSRPTTASALPHAGAARLLRRGRCSSAPSSSSTPSRSPSRSAAREFALLRSLGATRGQVLAGGRRRGRSCSASPRPSLGLLCGLGFAQRPRRALRRGRDGHPARRRWSSRRARSSSACPSASASPLGRRPAPGRARDARAAGRRHARRGAAEAPPRSRRRRRPSPRWSGSRGLALLVQGLFGQRPGQQPARARWALGSLLVFVGVAMSARYVVRPLAARRRLAARAPRARDRRARPRERHAQPGAHRDHRRGAHGRARARGLRGRLRRWPEDSFTGAIDERAKRRPRRDAATTGAALAARRGPASIACRGRRWPRAAVPRPGPGQRAAASTR